MGTSWQSTAGLQQIKTTYNQADIQMTEETKKDMIIGFHFNLLIYTK